MRILGRIRSWLKIKKRVKDDSRSPSKTDSPRRKRSRSLTDSAIPSYATRHAQFANGSNTRLDRLFDTTRTRNTDNDDTASDITPGATLISRDFALIAGSHDEHGAQHSVRIVRPSSSAQHLFVSDPPPLSTEKAFPATPAISPPLVPFSALVHPKTTPAVNKPTKRLSSPQPSPPNHTQATKGTTPSLEVSPGRLADLRRSSGVTAVLQIYECERDDAGEITSTRHFDVPPPTLRREDSNQSPNNKGVVKVDEEAYSPSSPNRRRFTHTGTSSPSSSPITAISAGARAERQSPRPQQQRRQEQQLVTQALAPPADATQFHPGSAADISVISSANTSASVLNSSSERELATSEVSTAVRARVQHVKRMSKDLVNLPDAAATTTARDNEANINNNDITDGSAVWKERGSLKPNPLKKIMSINALDTEIENQERRRKGGSLPSTPTWTPDGQAFSLAAAPPIPPPTTQLIPPSPAPSHTSTAPPSPIPPNITSAHPTPALKPPPKDRKPPPSRLKRPKTADDAAGALSPPPWRTVSSVGARETVVKDMGGGVSVVRIPAAPRMRRPATSAGIISPRENDNIEEEGGSLVRSTTREHAAFARSVAVAKGRGEDTVPVSFGTGTLGSTARDSVQVLVKRRSIRSTTGLVIPGEDESTPLRRKPSNSRTPMIRKAISEGTFQVQAQTQTPIHTGHHDHDYESGPPVRVGSLRKVGSVPLKKSVEERPARRTRRKKKGSRSRLSFVLATSDVEPVTDAGTSIGQGYALQARRKRSISSLGSVRSESGEGNDFTDSRSTFGKCNSDDEVNLSADLSEAAREMMERIRMRKGQGGSRSVLRNDVGGGVGGALLAACEA